MKTLTVHTGRSYEILIGPGLLEQAGERIRPLTKAQRAVIVSDSHVFPLYGEALRRSLQAAGLTVSEFVFPAGEEQKKLSTIEEMYAAFWSAGLTRTDIAVALGGGVTGDMTGFAAATYLRGIDFIQIPTSLLAQVDSSVGGKTGVDLPGGKNLVGAFWQPRLVLIDTDTLRTLPEHFIHDGMGEIIKYGCIRSLPLFETLEQEDPMDRIEEIIEQCVTIKRDIVERDERDTGERAVLNFGHTFGHALEKLSGFKDLTHGEAVGLGSLLLTEIAEKKGITKPGTAARIRALLLKNQMPTQTDFSLPDILQAAKGDKKSSGKMLHYVFIPEIGRTEIIPVPVDSMAEFFCRLKAPCVFTGTAETMTKRTV